MATPARATPGPDVGPWPERRVRSTDDDIRGVGAVRTAVPGITDVAEQDRKVRIAKGDREGGDLVRAANVVVDEPY